MDTQSLFIFQIIADGVLCLVILFFLIRLGRNIGKAGTPALEEKHLAEFRKLIQESREETGRFSRTMEESCRKFRDLGAALADGEARLAGLIQEAKRLQSPDHRDIAAGDDPYEPILQAFRKGTGVKEIARQSGLTEGEVSLIIDLDNKKRGKTPR